MSVCLTVSVGAAMGGFTKLFTEIVIISALVPLVVAPIVSGAAMVLLHEVDSARKALHQLAVRDGLTNLYNRRFFMARLQAEVSRAQREGTLLAVVMLDVDHFKAINDKRGHAVGDDVLVRLGSLLVVGLRPYDISARYGGEEFMAMLPGASSAEAEAAAERLRLMVEKLTIPGFDDARMPNVTASLGVSCLGPAPDDAASLLRRADEAMYAAKVSGRNRWVSVPAPSCAVSAAA